MKADLIIPMEEECVNCPNLKLETVKYFSISNVSVHKCVHIDFCKTIVQNMKKHGWKKEGEN